MPLPDTRIQLADHLWLYPEPEHGCHVLDVYDVKTQNHYHKTTYVSDERLTEIKALPKSERTAFVLQRRLWPGWQARPST